MKALMAWLILILFVVALVIAVLHSTTIGALVCGGTFMLFVFLVLAGAI